MTERQLALTSRSVEKLDSLRNPENQPKSLAANDFEGELSELIAEAPKLQRSLGNLRLKTLPSRILMFTRSPAL